MSLSPSTSEAVTGERVSSLPLTRRLLFGLVVVLTLALSIASLLPLFSVGRPTELLDLSSFLHRSSKPQAYGIERRERYRVLHIKQTDDALELTLAASRILDGRPRDLWLLMRVNGSAPGLRLLQGEREIGSQSLAQLPMSDSFSFLRIGELPPEILEEPARLRLGFQPVDGPYAVSIAAAYTAPPGLEKAEFLAGLADATDSTAIWKALFYLTLGSWLTAHLLGRSNRRSAVVIATGLLIFAALGLRAENPGIPRSWVVSIAQPDLQLLPKSRSYFEQIFTRVVAALPESPVEPPRAPGARSEGTLPVEIFVSTDQQSNAQPLEDIFGGWYAKVQSTKLSDFLPLAIVWGLTLVVSVAVTRIKKQATMSWLPLLCASAFSVLLSIRLGSGWDELFINLRHSYMLLHHGHFSFNAHEMGEGTVDFLPFLLTAGLGLLGMDLVDAIMSITLFGNLLLVFAGYQIAKRYTDSQLFALTLGSATGLFPGALFVAGTGFTATLFTGLILWSFCLLFLSSERGRLPGLLILGSLTLVRTEGVMLAGMFFAYEMLVAKWQSLSRLGFDRLLPFVRSNISTASILFGPFVLSCLVRKWAFGSAIPNPILFKNGAGNLEFLKAGLGQLQTSVLGYHLDWLLLIFLSVCILGYGPKLKRFAVLWQLSLLLLFVLPYFSSGGDWFFIEWNRYMMPFTIAFYLYSACILFELLPRYFSALSGVAALALFLFFGLLWRDAPDPSNVFTGGYISQLPYLHKWDRVARLHALGRFLGATTPEDATIASAEMATIMYAADRELVDLLGTVNPEIARAEIRPRLPKGDLVHRKRFPETLKHQRPDILAFYEPVLSVELPIEPPSLTELTERITTLFYNQEFVDIAFYRGGTYDGLLQQGFVPMAIIFRNQVFSYLVHRRIYDTHRARLLALGLSSVGTAQVPYRVTPELMERFGVS